jgi:hypothetical protein
MSLMIISGRKLRPRWLVCTHSYPASPVSLDRNTDKMTDQEKIPLAIAGILFITLPFLAGLIALYASK